jgi:DNA-binding MarR family transcriptional regulator
MKSGANRGPADIDITEAETPTAPPDAPSDGAEGQGDDVDYSHQLEQATRGLLELTVAILEQMDKTIGLTSLRALQALRRRGPSTVTELADEIDLLVSTASRLGDRLTEAGLITRRVSPTNRRATELTLAPHGQAVLDDLVAVRTAALAEVTAHMTARHRQALLQGAQAFTVARTKLTHQADNGETPENLRKPAHGTPREPDQLK